MPSAVSPEHVTRIPSEEFLRVATAVPHQKVGDVGENLRAITELWVEAADQQVGIAVFPELALCGYTIADLVLNAHLLDNVERSITNLVAASATNPTVLVVGAPIRHRDKLFNSAVVIAGGQIAGVVPKTWLPSYGEYYESRWFQPATPGLGEVELAGATVPFGTHLLFAIGAATFGIEICEDLWVPHSPGTDLALAGADVVCNLSASNEVLGKADWRRTLVRAQSGRTLGAYVYCSAGVSESVADTVFSGHCMIAENGVILAESSRFSRQPQLTVADLHIGAIHHDRRRSSTFRTTAPARVIELDPPIEFHSLQRRIDPHPFVPDDEASRTERCEEILTICAQGLRTAMEAAGVTHLTIGLSGGLDSTLALLTAIRALDEMDIPRTNLTAIVMPGHASSDRTQSNAQRLGTELGVTTNITPIGELTNLALEAIDHDGITQDITYENTQARLRTLLLMNTANHIGGFVVGTGDLSELALGWCTYNGDHMSMYNVNVGIPKTLVRHLVATAARWERFTQVTAILHDIIDTPISPELTKHDDTITQHTEDVVGPYELADFFLFHLIRHGSRPTTIAALAGVAFAGRYTPEEIAHWCNEFLGRFTRAQFKRDVLPNGPKVGSVALSPRADWRMSPQAGAWYEPLID